MNLSLEEHIILTNGVLLESPYMLQRFLKRLGYGWKRFRKSLKKEQDEQQYRRKLAELKDLIKLNQQGYIDFFFADKVLRPIKVEILYPIQYPIKKPFITN